LVLAAVFFTILSFYQHEGRGDPTMLNIAFVIYLIALFTDFLDGYLAGGGRSRARSGASSTPFVDKVARHRQLHLLRRQELHHPRDGPAPGSDEVVKTISGVVPGMVVVILARELFVTSFRGMSEGTGQAFGAQFSGKLKMVFQSITILVILVYVNYFDRWFSGQAVEQAARVIRDICIWLTILITVWSGLLYVQRVRTAYQG
jgi:CDP-diacylglycerol--glycerol-3-phosphate 3-phosphatidyltransferase